MRGALRTAGALFSLVLLSGCAGVLRPPSDPEPGDPDHPLQLHQRMTEESLRQHREAHEAAVRAAETAHREAAQNHPPLPPPPPIG